MSGGNLTNADFRSLLLNTGSDLSVLQQFSKNSKKKNTDDNEKANKRKLRYLQIQKRQKEKENEIGEKNDKEIYRDRASERRKGNAFFSKVASELESMQTRSLEESKYLGGDEEHTHLVKGLDFALLSKTRRDFAKPRPEEEKKENKIILKNNIARRIYYTLLASCHPHHVHFKDRIARVHKTLLLGATFKGNSEIFLPGRTHYNFDCQTSMTNSDIPPTIFSAANDCLPPPEGLTLQCPPDLLRDLSQILTWHAANKKKMRQERVNRRPGEGLIFFRNKIMSAPTEDDIFGKEDLVEAKNTSDVIRDDEGMDIGDDSVALMTEEDFQKKYENYSNSLEEKSKIEISQIPEIEEKKTRRHEDSSYQECYPDYTFGVGDDGLSDGEMENKNLKKPGFTSEKGKAKKKRKRE